MSVNQNDIDALLNSEADPEDASNNNSSVDDIVAQTLETEAAASEKTGKTSTPPKVASKVKLASIDISNLSCSDSLEQIRAAQKILFEVFSNIPDKKERARLLNWATDAFIKSKFF